MHLDWVGLVERPLYLKDGSTGWTGSADVVGVTKPLLANGSASIVREYTIAPSSRFTLKVDDVVGDGANGKNVSLVVESHVTIVAERPMYFNFPTNQTSGSDVGGYQPDL